MRQPASVTDLWHQLALPDTAAKLATVRHQLAETHPKSRPVASAVRALKRVERYLARPHRLAVLGEFNTGKSSIANLLVGDALMPAHPIANTRVPTIIQYALAPQVVAVHEDGSEVVLHKGHNPDFDISAIACVNVGLPNPLLQYMEILDVPGTSDPRLGNVSPELHRFRLDAVVWCTLATQAWKESERAMWLRTPRKLQQRSLLVATNKDLLKIETELDKVAARLEQVAGSHFREIILVSAPEALQAMGGIGDEPDDVLWRTSGGEALYNGLAELLSSLAAQRRDAVHAALGRISRRALRWLEKAPAPR